MNKKANYIIENIVHQQLKKHLNEANNSDIINGLYIKTMEQIQEMFPNNKELSGGYMFMNKQGYYFNISEPIIKDNYISVYTLFDIDDQDDSDENAFFIDEIQDYKKFMLSLKSDAKRVITYTNKLQSKIDNILKLQDVYERKWDGEECAFTDEDYNDYRVHQLFLKDGNLYYSLFYDWDKNPQTLDKEDYPDDLFSLLKKDNKRKIKMDGMDSDEIDKRKDGEVEDDEDYDEDDE